MLGHFVWWLVRDRVTLLLEAQDREIKEFLTNDLASKIDDLLTDHSEKVRAVFAQTVNDIEVRNRKWLEGEVLPKLEQALGGAVRVKLEACSDIGDALDVLDKLKEV
jgi:hypothetical protein